MSWLRFAFDFSGRLNRLQLLAGALLIGLLSSLLTLPFLLRLPPASGGGVTLTREYEIATNVIDLIFAVPVLSLLVRRAHDLGLTGFVVLLLLAWTLGGNAVLAIWPDLNNSFVEIVFALVGVLAGFALVLSPGQNGDNRFGSAPRSGWRSF